MKRLPWWIMVSSVVHIVLITGVMAVCAMYTTPQLPIVIDFSIKYTPTIQHQAQINSEHKRNYHKKTYPTSRLKPQVAIPEISDTVVMMVDTIKNIATTNVNESMLIKTTAYSDSASSDEQLKKVYTSTNFDYIREQVYKGLIYPPVAIENSWEGAVMVSFLVDNNGNIDSVRILKSSGRRLLDLNALSAVKHAAPFPKSSSRVEIRLPVLYKLEG
jgi:TonB family protein